MNMKLFVALAVGVIISGTLGYVGWVWERKINYEFGYKDQVEQHIKELVKPECLR